MAIRIGGAAGADPARVLIARYLGAHGPTPGDELAAALGLTPGRFWERINSPWFEITGKGWRLTGRGQAEGAGA